MKRLFFALSVLFLSTSVFAQGFEWGVKAGLNLASITKTDEAKMRTGLHAGVFGEYFVNDFFGIQGELLYSMMGAKGELEVVGVSVTSKVDFIVLPILAKIYLMENFSLDIGPQFGYMVSAKIAGSGGSISYYDKVDNKFDLSVGMGLSYKLPYNLGVSARYNLGLTEINEGADPKRSVIQVGVSYRF